MSLTINHQTNDISATSGSVTLDGAGVGSPAGSVIYHAANTAPTGFLKANGAAVSRSTYATLFSAIGTTFGAGDGSSTFNVPDLRGEFMRGWDDSRGVDGSRAFGSTQADQMEAHTHTYSRVDSSGGSSGGTGYYAGYTVLNTSSQGGTSNSSENRPRNIALLACIKY
jgi:microcystin-dependent protein